MDLEIFHKSLPWEDARHDNIKVAVNAPKQIVVYVDAGVLVRHGWDVDVAGMAQRNGKKMPVSVDLLSKDYPDIIRFRPDNSSRRHLTRVDTKSQEEKDLRVLGSNTWPVNCGTIHAQYPLKICWWGEGPGCEDSLFIRLPPIFLCPRNDILIHAAPSPVNGELLLSPVTADGLDDRDPVDDLMRDLDALAAPPQQDSEDPVIATIATLTFGLHGLPQKVKEGFAKAFRDGRTRDEAMATAERYLFREYGQRRKIPLDPKVVRGVVSHFLSGLESNG